MSDHDWGITQRFSAEERFKVIEAMLDEVEVEVEALLSRVKAALDDEAQPAQARR